MQFEILPPTNGLLFEDDDIAVHDFLGVDKKGFQTKGSLFFVVIAGRVSINGHSLRSGMYGCLPRLGLFDADDDCRVMICDAKRYPGMFSLGGPIEPIGRLRYINGCTDTGILQPAKLGDPCLNALFFPSGILQTPHTHPSHRIGSIFDGDGLCHHDTQTTPMRQGDIFIIPTDTLHWFETDSQQAMRIMVFHPDSEFGPTDEHHQMLDATIIA